jgi:hypothetical protein
MSPCGARAKLGSEVGDGFIVVLVVAGRSPQGRCSYALATVTGYPIIITIAPLIAISSVAVVSAVALAILALPGYLAVGVRPTMVSST